MRRYELTPVEWERESPILPAQNTGQKGRPPKDNRVMLNGMLWIDRSGTQWRECYGPWQSVYARFRKGKDEGVFERIFKELSADYDPENLSVDSTCSKVRQSANGNKKGR